ncbi:MAG: copper chaperone PCu(A)C [Alteromonadaceae bacterium]|nr:copper chaperone PCu(A)C [Alteromonadaceae bacterium]
MNKAYSNTLIIYILLTYVIGFNAIAEKKVDKSFNKAEISVNTGYIRETIPGTSISSAYMTIHNSSLQKLSFIGASSDVSPRVEIHEHTMDNGMMRMRQRLSIEIPAQNTVVLHPSGLHLMIFDLNQPLKQDQMVSITLHFADHKDFTIQLPVQSIKNKQRSKQHQHKHQ